MDDPSFDFGILKMEGGSIGIASNHSDELMMPEKFPASINGHPNGVKIAFLSNDIPREYRQAIDTDAESLTKPRKMEWGKKSKAGYTYGSPLQIIWYPDTRIALFEIFGVEKNQDASFVPCCGANYSIRDFQFVFFSNTHRHCGYIP